MEKSSVLTLKGIGPKRAKLLEKLQIKDLHDLLYHIPREYEDRSSFCPLSRLNIGELVTIFAEISSLEEINSRRGLHIFKAVLSDEIGNSCTAVWFNQPFLKKQLKLGEKIIVTGKVMERQGYSQTLLQGTRQGIQERQDQDKEQEKGQKEIQVRDYERISEHEMSVAVEGIIPVYPSTEGLNQRFWRDIQKQLIKEKEYASKISEIFGEAERKEYQLMPVTQAWEEIHFPTDFVSLEKARYRLAFEELYTWQFALAFLRQERIELKKGYCHADRALCEKFIDLLSFELTEAQKRVIKEVEIDMELLTPMQRLIQGDVGSGKTVIAAWAILKAVGSGYQGILMVPTEVLARQHYAAMQSWFQALGVQTALLTGGLSAKEKKKILEEIRKGSYQVIVGTHALLEENVEFPKAGLVVIDEQHRFGVRQRALLEEKGLCPDVLVMSATPIPRTLAMTLYGDLEISVLDELPPGRKPVLTYCLKEEAHAKITRFLEQQLEVGAQAYIVCPLVEESEKRDIKNAQDIFEKMRRDLPRWKMGIVHGRMKSTEKESIMESFRKGEIKVLVATTVIEVGVNVPRASVMIIEDADRFGLSQLHQLRGRVGRGTQQSYCLLVTAKKDVLALKRLKLMTEINDGFKLAEEDLKLRGPGEFFGVRQHGLSPFKMADLSRDGEILFQAKKLASEVLQNDPLLKKEEHQNLVDSIKVKLEKVGRKY